MTSSTPQSPHAETPNQVVGVDLVQVELKREDQDGQVEEVVRHFLTVVDLATDFCQQIVVPRERMHPPKLSIKYGDDHMGFQRLFSWILTTEQRHPNGKDILCETTLNCCMQPQNRIGNLEK